MNLFEYLTKNIPADELLLFDGNYTIDGKTVFVQNEKGEWIQTEPTSVIHEQMKLALEEKKYYDWVHDYNDGEKLELKRLKRAGVKTSYENLCYKNRNRKEDKREYLRRHNTFGGVTSYRCTYNGISTVMGYTLTSDMTERFFCWYDEIRKIHKWDNMES